MIRCVLFDLDGTLVRFDYDDFLKEYFKAITISVAPRIKAVRFTEALIRSVEAMIENEDPSLSNRQVFFEDFVKRVNTPEDILLPMFEDFYANEFTKLKDVLAIEPHPKARAMMEVLFKEGYDVVIATNALFPAMAILERMRWGGVYGFPYRLITCYETMHFCKPNLKYYEEILRITGYQPEDCLMVGNNMDEDIVAGALGIKTYLVDDYLLDSGMTHCTPDLRSDFSGFVEFVLSNGIQKL